MLQLEIEGSSDEEESVVCEEEGLIIQREAAGTGCVAQSSSSSPLRRERKALTAAAFSNSTSSSPNIGGIRPSSCSPRGWWCCVWLWLWSGGGQSSSSRWMQRLALLGMSLYLLFYHTSTPANWNPVKSDQESTTKKDNAVLHPAAAAQPPIIATLIPSQPSSSPLSAPQLTPNNDGNDEVVSPFTSSISSTSISSSKDDNMSRTGENSKEDDNDNDGDGSTRNVVRYSCPTTVTQPENLPVGTSSSSISSGGTIIITPHEKLIHNTTAYLSVFHSVEYDEMGFYSYDSVKQSMLHWKSTRFGDALQNGNAIFESGCGIGLNLIMTLEILYETRGIHNLQIHGNDYSADSIQIAHELIQHVVVSSPIPNDDGQQQQLGTPTLCRADSAKLHEFVPRNSFDLVFTGYITPLQDALQLNLPTQDDLDREYRVICQEEKQTTTLGRAADMQRRQEDWFGTWVNEMIRIAKPGAPVIIEQVSYPYCEALFDRGGVARDFWKIAVERYQWDVNVESIELENDSIMKSRYHVFMRKNNNKKQ